MCSAFDQYLESIRRCVIFVDDKSVLELSMRMTPLKMQILNLTRILSIHPDGKVC